MALLRRNFKRPADATVDAFVSPSAMVDRTVRRALGIPAAKPGRHTVPNPNIPGVKELARDVTLGRVSDFRVNPPFPPFDKYTRFAWVAGSYALDFAGIAGAFVYELPNDGGLVYHSCTVLDETTSSSLSA